MNLFNRISISYPHYTSCSLFIDFLDMLKDSCGFTLCNYYTFDHAECCMPTRAAKHPVTVVAYAWLFVSHNAPHFNKILTS